MGLACPDPTDRIHLFESKGDFGLLQARAPGRGAELDEVAQALGAAFVVDDGQMASTFGTWGKRETDCFDGQRRTRSD